MAASWGMTSYAMRIIMAEFEVRFGPPFRQKSDNGDCINRLLSLNMLSRVPTRLLRVFLAVNATCNPPKSAQRMAEFGSWPAFWQFN